MKKILTILLLMLLLFNLYGYKVWFYYLQQQSQQQMAKVIDKNSYDDSDLITLKVPLSLPYSTSWGDFERYDGNIEVNGQHYSYVKRKVQNDTLVLLCLPNTQQDKLTRSQTNFEGRIDSCNSTANGKASNPWLLIKLLAGEYYHNAALYQLTEPFSPLPNHATHYSALYYFYNTPSPWQPPDAIG